MSGLNEIAELPEDAGNKINKKYQKLKQLIAELNNRKLTTETVTDINDIIQQYNNHSQKTKSLSGLLGRTRILILKVVEKRMKLFPKNAMMTRWMAIGMAIFGVPMGVVYGLVLDNMAFMGVGISIGLSLGVGIGISLDKKIKKEGRQLNVEV